MASELNKKIALGTVQFGIDYGITNTHGRTSDIEVQRILQLALEYSITCIDTAYLYGTSEKVLGTSGLVDYFDVVTKTPRFEEKIINDKHISLLNTSFNESCERLKTKPTALLCHSADDLLKPGGIKLYNAMTNLKASGFVDKIGVSVYSPNQCQECTSRYDMDLIQLPLSIFDQRFLKQGVIEQLSNNGVAVHIRSVFLQGLLLMKNLPTFFEPIREVHAAFNEFCASIKQSPLEVAIQFVAAVSGVDKIVVGTNSASQLREILELESFDADPNEFERFAVENEEMINPSKWALNA